MNLSLVCVFLIVMGIINTKVERKMKNDKRKNRNNSN